jgi:peroxiredoxin
MKRVNDNAPGFDLQDANGAPISLKNSLDGKPAVVALFKVGCPTCQYAFPFLDRLYKSGVKVIGISQDSAKDTRDFAKQFGVSFPLAIDAPKYTISKSYGITTVPSIFVVDEDGSIRYVAEGWVRKDFEELARIASAGSAPPALFKPSESVLDFKAG